MFGGGRGRGVKHLFYKSGECLIVLCTFGFTRNFYYFYNIDLKLKDTKSKYYGILYNLFQSNLKYYLCQFSI